MKAILTYHSIDESGSPVSVAPDAFARHHAWLTSGAVRVLPLDRLEADEAGGDAVAVTFDDAFLNTRDPIVRLAEAGVPVTVFVVSGHVGGTNAWGGRDEPGIPTLPLMGWDDLAMLASRGVSLASHTRTHPHLTTVPPDARAEELAGSRADLEARLGTIADDICYPYGDVNDAVAAEAGATYRRGCTTAFRWLDAADAAMALPRLDMYYFRAAGALEAWGTPALRRRVRWVQLRRAIRARLVRARPAPSSPAVPPGAGAVRG